MVAGFAIAQTQTTECSSTSTSCTGSNQWSGDVSTVNNSGETHSTTTQNGNSSASNASGVDINPTFDNRTQTTQNATNTTTGTISGGNTSSSVGNTSATGNYSSNDNKSSVGNTTATTGASTSNSNSGGNVLGNTGTNTSTNNNSNSATGGAGGSSTAYGGTTTSKVSDSGNSSSSSGVSGSGNSSQGQGQSQGIAGSGNSSQGQTQGISGSGNSKNTSTLVGGNTSSSNSNSLQGGTQNSSTSSSSSLGNAGNSSIAYTDNSKVDARTLILPNLPNTPPSVIAAGQMIKETTACGPLQNVDKQPVTAIIRGGFMNWSWKEVSAGDTMHLTNMVDPDGRIMYFYEVNVPGRDEVYLYGHQAVIVYALIGTSSATQTGLGLGGGTAMNWGQGNNGSTNSTQRLVSDIQLKLCPLGVAKVLRQNQKQVFHIEKVTE